MPKIHKDSYQKGPLLIKIEACPRSGKKDCSEDCNKDCPHKAYTIFEPKPPRRKSKDSGDEPKQSPRISRNSHEDSGSRHSRTPKHSFEENLEESPKIVALRVSKSPEDSIDSHSHRSSGSHRSSSSRSTKSRSNVEEPQIVTSAIEEKSEESDCVLEICVREIHKKSCKHWNDPSKAHGEYNVISRQIIKLCRGAPDDSTKAPVHPICIKCECDTRKPVTYVREGTEKGQIKDEEISEDLSEPSTYVESAFSRESEEGTLPDFRNMPITPHIAEKKPSLLQKIFKKNKKSRSKKPVENINDKGIIQCPCPAQSSPEK